MYFNCKGEDSTSLLTFHVIVALPDDGRISRQKLVAVNIINK